jgi:predicted  nucleic acid-binding Zn-ribbon protein
MSSENNNRRRSGKRWSHDEFMSFVKPTLHNDIQITGLYTHSQTPIEVKCNRCGEKFTMHPKSLLNGKGHKKCKLQDFWDSVKKQTIEKNKARVARSEVKQKQCFYPPKPLNHFLDGLHEHHMIPRFMGGDDSPTNLVKLIPIDHAIAHFVRYKLYKKHGDLYAYQILMGSIGDGIFEHAALLGANNPMKRPEVREKHLASMKNRLVVYKTGDAHIKYWSGKNFSEEHKKKISDIGKGKKKPASMKEKLRSRKGEGHHLSEGVWVDDVYYGSKRQAEIALGWGKGTLNYRLKNNPSKWNIKIPDKN